mmetsp:Transcript_16667/g.15961  ORF Transcript_16667/g.15961 Transcript_16667/m.15961 type:complete len:83 (+) Transcript_16667:537-785(+)
MLMEGGDTDTNAAIVGGLVGAACGLKEIIEAKKDWVEKVARATHSRPDFVQPKEHLSKIVDLVKTKPNKELLQKKLEGYKHP